MTSNAAKSALKGPSPEEYRRFIQGIDLRSIQLVEMAAKSNSAEFNGGLKISIQSESDFSPDESGFRIRHSCELVGRNSQRKIAIKISAVYLIYFSSHRDMTPEYFAVYKEASLPINIWPFFRELVHATTSRMNIPPLTLPLVKR
ncbi:MAG TPA: hypothetical protein PKI81_08460 [bacterium]|jgi:hypothetical protein|nr:hypothetical protein [bacterium]HOZ22700.1 hypothetical protein [bacterium]